MRKMAGQLINVRKSFQILLQKNNISHLPRCFASAAARRRKRNEVSVGNGKSVESVSKSLASKGFLRPNKPYAAPANVTEKVFAICSSLNISSTGDYKLDTLEEKFKFLDACFKDFKHSVPNSQVHELETVGDVIRFYEGSVSTTVPYDALKKMDLPENLHIQYDYVRFHPETDTKFNGQTAFPKSSTLVTGLKYRGKYEGHEAKRSWP